MIWAILGILLVLWLVGFILDFVIGGLLHILLIAAVVILIYGLLRKRTTT